MHQFLTGSIMMSIWYISFILFQFISVWNVWISVCVVYLTVGLSSTTSTVTLVIFGVYIISVWRRRRFGRSTSACWLCTNIRLRAFIWWSIVPNTRCIRHHVGNVVLLMNAVEEMGHRPPGVYGNILASMGFWVERDSRWILEIFAPWNICICQRSKLHVAYMYIILTSHQNAKICFSFISQETWGPCTNISSWISMLNM